MQAVRDRVEVVREEDADPTEVSPAPTPAFPVTGTSSGHLDTDGQFMITQTSSWIVNADAKAGLLLAALAVLGAALTGQLQSTLRRYLVFGVREVAALVLFAVAVAMLGISVFYIYRVLIPRLDETSSESRFSWPWVSQQAPDLILRREPGGVRREAWVQAVALSGIARAKFSAFRAALQFAIIGSVFLLAGSVVGF
jgi:hypothetical protein